MKFVKFSAGALCAVFFFALGIFFQARIQPQEGTREPASYVSSGPRGMPGGKFDNKTTEAFRACLDSNVTRGSVKVGKTSVDGRKWSIVSIPCNGATAKQLFDSILPYSTEELVSYRDSRKGVVRFFGRLYPPSQCVEILADGKGRALNNYSCSIRIDVDSEITEQLKL